MVTLIVHNRRNSGMKSSRLELLELCDAWREKVGLAETTLSMLLFGVSRTLSRIRSGSRLDIDTYDRAMGWLNANPAETYRKLHPRGRPPVRRRNTETMNAG